MTSHIFNSTSSNTRQHPQRTTTTSTRPKPLPRNRAPQIRFEHGIARLENHINDLFQSIYHKLDENLRSLTQQHQTMSQTPHANMPPVNEHQSTNQRPQLPPMTRDQRQELQTYLDTLRREFEAELPEHERALGWLGPRLDPEHFLHYLMAQEEAYGEPNQPAPGRGEESEGAGRETSERSSSPAASPPSEARESDEVSQTDIQETDGVRRASVRTVGSVVSESSSSSAAPQSEDEASETEIPESEAGEETSSSESSSESEDDDDDDDDGDRQPTPPAHPNKSARPRPSRITYTSSSPSPSPANESPRQASPDIKRGSGVWKRYTTRSGPALTLDLEEDPLRKARRLRQERVSKGQVSPSHASVEAQGRQPESGGMGLRRSRRIRGEEVKVPLAVEKRGRKRGRGSGGSGSGSEWEEEDERLVRKRR